MPISPYLVVEAVRGTFSGDFTFWRVKGSEARSGYVPRGEVAVRRILVVHGVVLALQAFLLAPANAHTGPGNAWTQLDNHNWPANSSNPNCGPCVRWPIGGTGAFYEGVWTYQVSGPSWVHTDAQAAIKEWSGQPYDDPTFTENGGSCSGDDLCVTVVSTLPSSWCGNTPISYYYSGNDGTITHAIIELSTTASNGYVDGATTSGCDMRDTLHHEAGHAYSEGHSAVKTDLMYTNNNNVEHVDGDSQAELAAVYGPEGGTGGGGSGCLGSATDSPDSPCLSLATLKAKLLSEAQSLEGTPTMQRVTF